MKVFHCVALFPNSERDSLEISSQSTVCVCVCMYVCMCVLVAQSCRFFAASWTVAHQAPLSMEFSRQEYWNV